MRTPTEKAAILLVSLGEELAANLLRQMQPDQAHRILSHMATLKQIDQATAAAIIEEFSDLLQKGQVKTPALSPRDTAISLIEKHLGSKAAHDFSNNIAPELPASFRMIETADAKGLAGILSAERPTTTAAILANMTPKKAAQLLACFSSAYQLQVVVAIAHLQPLNPEILHEIDEVLKDALQRLQQRGTKTTGGVKKAADILAQLGQSQGQQILENMEHNAQDLAREIKGAMFTFEDLQRLDNRGLELLLRKVPQQTLETALRKASSALTQRFLSNMSQRLAKQVQDNMQISKPVLMSLVEEKQREIVKLALGLIAAGEIQDPAAEAV